MRSQILIALLALLVACGGKQSSSPPKPVAAEKSLYERLGGEDAIKAIVDELVTNVMKNPRINAMFAAADLPSLKKKLVDQLCQAAKGPCVYTGKTMKETHLSMNIKKADFDVFVFDVVAAMKTFDVGEEEQREILDLLRSMEKDIVTAQ